MLKQVITAIAASCLIGGAYAQTSGKDPNRIITSVTYTDLTDLVASQGHTIKSSDQAEMIVTAKTDDGPMYILNGTACNDSNTCSGLNMIISYSVPDGLDLNKVNDADTTYAAVSVWQNGENTLALSRYLILDEGMRFKNLIPNLKTLISVAPKVKEKATGETQTSSPSISYGDDSGEYANDGTCDDGRFHRNGDESNYKRKHVERDATDCRKAVASGDVSLILDFGDNSGSYADDDTCDDIRFTGEGRSILQTDSHIKKDAADCIKEYRAGRITRKVG
jgi:hypothetical protein